jgi:hypothetical protein
MIIFDGKGDLEVFHVLYYTGNRYNFYDVVVMLLDEIVMGEQIEKARSRVERDSSISSEQRLNFEMSVKNLVKSLSDRERIPKIQGLVNECMTFLDDDLAQVTGQYHDLLSIDQIIDEQLILFVSLNINKKTEAVRSLSKNVVGEHSALHRQEVRIPRCGETRRAWILLDYPGRIQSFWLQELLADSKYDARSGNGVPVFPSVAAATGRGRPRFRRGHIVSS